MKRLLMLVAVAAVAGAMYVAASPASQQSRGPTLKQFNALKKQVASLSKSLKTVVKPEADISASYILTCLSSVSGGSITINAMPVSQRGSSASGYLFGTTVSSTPTTALDINTSAPTDVLQEFDPSCLSGALRHTAARSGITRLHYGMAKDSR
ncbi:MAG TPA: hypothetical protein VGM45_08335 [Gaiellaceae bacterium]|jgi:hypothetical protein